MPTTDVNKLRGLTRFPDLIDYLRDELDWPIEVEDADEITFEYDPDELGIDPQNAVRIESIRQIRPLVDGQPWGIFFIEFETRRLPVVVLRRILRALVPSSRRRDPNQPVWHMTDLLFISAQGERGYRSISFAHFQQRPGQLPELRTFSWDAHETHFFYLKNLNLEALRWPKTTNPVIWRAQWSQAFTTGHRYVIEKSQELAREMAYHAAVVRELVEEVYGLEREDDPLHLLYGSFKEVLLHDLTPAAFADMVAQTVAYGLFSAATQNSEELTYEHMVDLIPNTNPFLKELLAELTRNWQIDLEELGVGQLVELLRRTNIQAILHDFGRQSGGGREDPVIHFYELFLSEYDRTQKVQRGVFYTPDPVVSYIVRSVDHLLKTEFGLPDGLADTTIDPETGQPWVQILDPATGTGTFLAHVIDQIERTVKARPGVDWNAYVAEHLLPRLNGFELLMAPYAVAHMKLGLKLRQTGYNFASDERLRVYLSNTLEEPVERHETLALTGFLSKEANEAARVKRQVPITVVIGNPPYSGHSANQSEWIAGLLRGIDDKGRPVGNYFEVDGQPLNERNPKWLNDDYVKFIRFAQWRIKKTGAGILAFITNHGYLDNPTFRGMRLQLIKAFTDIYILNLHGNSKKKEVAPDRSPDKNVFDIQQGVAVGIFVYDSKKERSVEQPARVYYAELWGLREYKYDYLLKQSIDSAEWNLLMPQSPFYFFIPQDIDLRGEYDLGWNTAEIFPVNSVGIVTARDHLSIHLSSRKVWETVKDFSSLSPEVARKKYDLGPDVQDWKVHLAQADVLSSGPNHNKVVPILYRPFDTRFTYYTGQSRGFICRPRGEVMPNILMGENFGLITTRQTRDQWDSFVTRSICGHKSCAAYDINFLFPLYLYPTSQPASQHFLFKASPWPSGLNGRVPNLNPNFVDNLEHRLSQVFIPDGTGNLYTTFGPEDIFHYTYAVFHSPTYRSRYAEFLKIDFPRLPLTTDLELFRALCSLGADLVALHLLEDDYPAASWSAAGTSSPLSQPITTFVRRGTGAAVGAMSKNSVYDKGRVYLDTSNRARSSYFDGVPEEVWNFQIGGYQVCHKWLYDRRGSGGQPGRTLTEEDIAHYQRIVVALNETIRLMAEIDAVIEDHGGWPLVGSVEEG